MAGMKKAIVDKVLARCENCGKTQVVEREQMARSICEGCGQSGFAVRPPAGQGGFKF
jgi:ribosomal protein S27E